MAVASLLLSLQAADFNAEGMKALEAEKYEEAARAFEKAVENDPQDYAARFHLALAHSLLGRRAEAIAGYEKTLELKPGLYEAELNAGILLLDDKQLEKAESRLRSAAEQKPAEFRPNYFLAETLLEKGDAPGAERFYRAASEANPKEAAALAGLGRAMAKQGKLDQAAEVLNRVVEADPKYEGVLLELASLYEQDRKLPEAIALYRRFPDNAAARERVGQLLLESGKLEESIEELQVAVRESPTAANRYALATAYLRNKRLDEAAALLALAAQDEPANVDLRMTYGRVLRDQGKYAPAAQEFLTAAKAQPDSKEAWSELAAMLVLTDSFPQALAALDRVEALDPAAAAPHFLRAMILDKGKQYQPALASYQRFLSMSNGAHPDEEFKARQRVKVIQKELSKR
ncbi:MAG: tetratricopeptide repeat protein [Bryobacteraceae bacterium]|nr:tetratricopeptide repeat protein [Bryobacteraceae bacterium]